MRALSPQQKVISAASAARLIRAYHAKGQIVGCMSGSFDIMTAIHFKALEERAKKCDVLFVLLNSDASVRGYKGIAKPILDQSERAYTLAQSPFVHHIIIFDELTPNTLLARLAPDVFLNVSEWGDDCVERKIVESYGGKIKVFNFKEPVSWSKSTSELLSRIAASDAKKVRRAVFLDRDGVINENKDGYLHRYEDITYKPHLIPALKAYIKAGYVLIIITNQSGIARGYYTEKQMHTLHKKMTAYFKSQGVVIEAIYHCPHGPDDGCVCRKPGIGMLVRAALEQNLNLSKSWFIGDSASDVEAGRFANVKTIFIGSESTYSKKAYRPNYFVSNMKEAQSCILPTN